jgi:uncharacterized protein
VGGDVAVLQYERRPGIVVLVHTEVPLPLRRQGIGSLLAKTALESARREGVRVIATCAFVRAYMKKHPSR